MIIVTRVSFPQKINKREGALCHSLFIVMENKQQSREKTSFSFDTCNS